MTSYHYQEAGADSHPPSICGLSAYRNYVVLGPDGEPPYHQDNVCPTCSMLHMLDPKNTRTGAYVYYGEYVGLSRSVVTEKVMHISRISR